MIKVTNFWGAHAPLPGGGNDPDVYLRLVDDLNFSDGLAKLASGTKYTPETELFIVEKLPGLRKQGMVYLLDNALGAGEAWSSNVNGDWFSEKMLMEKHATFTSHAHPFLHHKNRDPRKAKGKILYSAYNPRMRRVELVVELDPEKAQEVIRALEDGNYPRTSMGFRAEYDTCSICGNVARSRSQYCDHLRKRMNEILPDGRKCCALNEKGHFFDHSYVIVPADKTAGTMTKIAFDPQAVEDCLYPGAAHALAAANVSSLEVAEACGYEEIGPLEKVAMAVGLQEKQASLPLVDSGDARTKKAARILVRRVFPMLGEVELEFNAETLDELAKFPLQEVLSTLGFMGVALKPREFQRITLGRFADDDLARELHEKRQTFQPGQEGDADLPMMPDFKHVSRPVMLVVRRSSTPKGLDWKRILQAVLSKPEGKEPDKPLPAKLSKLGAQLSKLYGTYRDGLSLLPQAEFVKTASRDPGLLEPDATKVNWLFRCHAAGGHLMDKEAAERRVEGVLMRHPDVVDRLLGVLDSAHASRLESLYKVASSWEAGSALVETLSLDTAETLVLECLTSHAD